MVERRDGAAAAASPDDRPGVRVRDDNDEVTEKAETDVDSARLLSSDRAIFIVRGSSQRNSDRQALAGSTNECADFNNKEEEDEEPPPVVRNKRDGWRRLAFDRHSFIRGSYLPDTSAKSLVDEQTESWYRDHKPRPLLSCG
jgi:hypothetical protein